MDKMLMLLVVPLLAALLSTLLNKYHKVVWTLFVVVSGYISYTLFTMFGNWDLVWSTKLNFELFNSNITLAFANNPLGWFFAFFASAITLLISLFSLAYNDEKHNSKITPIWFMLIFANLGIFFAKDWLLFFMMWEVMGWTSYFIVAHGKKISAKAARFYLSLSLVGTSSLLLGIMLIAQKTKTFDIQTSIKAMIDLFSTNHSMALFYLGLFGITFFIKSAVFPFYMWPSKAYAEAPDDFTPFLSAVMSKYGVYGIALFILPILQKANIPALGRINGPAYLLAWMGAITAVLATILAIFQTDMKKLFAYSSVSNIGYIVMGLSTMSIAGVQGALFHSVNHMVFKTAIFLSLAAVIYRTGERDMHKVGGLVYRMPLTFMTYLLAIIAAAGIPPLNGFPSKWLIVQALISKRMLFVVIAMIFASTGAFMYLFRCLASVFLGQLPDHLKDVKEAPVFMAIPMVILMILMLAIGVIPGIVLKPLNTVLAALGYKVSVASWTTLHSSLSNSDVNITVLFGIFVAGFVVSAILYIISGKQTKVAQEDNYTAGEEPLDWGTTPDRFNFSYGFYQPFKEIFNPLLDKISFDRWMSAFGRNVERVSCALSSLYTKGEGAVLMFCIGVVLFIVGGWLV
ncbi:hydrogenase-4 component B [Clostridium tepidiprofundi DSM 19306]|uniref:Hydrogenase-4 component B n=1 Tax=Clostridium tepidiprofundi DSM 19306 TaxID=1121338 RepID=A0A151B6L4_9CLOT|nr:proton-conducting transporter membrane subunit [Clostridium tepidiprofundi]KYH35287.1 hydrogenase-4 component B [Clostridium tepidiprofundi DSM 19306]